MMRPTLKPTMKGTPAMGSLASSEDSNGEAKSWGTCVFSWMHISTEERLVFLGQSGSRLVALLEPEFGKRMLLSAIYHHRQGCLLTATAHHGYKIQSTKILKRITNWKLIQCPYWMNLSWFSKAFERLSIFVDTSLFWTLATFPLCILTFFSH